MGVERVCMYMYIHVEMVRVEMVRESGSVLSRVQHSMCVCMCMHG